MATFTFSGSSKLVIVDPEVGDSSFTPAELYSAWKDWVLSGNAQFEPAFAESVGGNDLGGGTLIDAYIFLRNDIGWRIRPDARDHVLVVDGNLYGVDPGTALFAATTSAAAVQIDRRFSSRALGVATGGADASAVANAVWAHASATSATSKLALIEKILRNKTVTNPSTGMMTVYDDNGVDVLLTASVFEDANGAQAYRGQGANRRDRLT